MNYRIILLQMLIAPLLFAQNVDVPKALQDWIPWVLHGEKALNCPFQYNSARKRVCSFPGQLQLDANPKGATFTQHWQVFEEGRYPLLGSHEHWPLEVTSQGKPVVVVPKNGLPSVFLSHGKHIIKGKFTWKQLPEFLQTPSHTGIIRLKVNGRNIPFSKLDSEGKLWFQKQIGENGDESEDHLEIKVHRLVTDDIPLIMKTSIEVSVSGQARAVELGPVLPKNFVPMELDSSLPATLKPNGLLRIQVRPGSWKIILSARHKGPVSEILLEPATHLWTPEEVWAFEAKNELRMVTIEGVPGVDPLQTTLPTEWNRYPAFLVKPGDTFTINERARGDADLASDRLGIVRTMWLDFDGKGISIRDRIEGTIKSSWRLEMNPTFSLGKVSVGGKNQLITNGKKPGWAGIELRDKTLRLEAHSRVNKFGLGIPSTGWSQDFQTMQGTLHLPPGWKAIAVTGADRTFGTWASYWNLGNVFLWVLLLLAVAKLKTKPWAIATGLILALVFPESGAPRYLWLLGLMTIVLHQLIPDGKVKNIASLIRFATLGFLGIVCLMFAHQQVRLGLYPVLEKGSRGITGGGYDDSWTQNVPSLTRNAPMAGSAMISQEADSIDKSRGFRKGYRNKSFKQKITRIDPNAVVQVGPGLPNWSWNTVRLRWSGPVSQKEKLSFFLTPPWLNSILNFIRAMSVLFLLGMLVKSSWTKLSLPQDKVRAMILLPLLLFGTNAYADTLPPSNLLKELKKRVQEPPKCFPNCASLQKMNLSYNPSSLTIRMEVDAAIPSAVPVPGGIAQWIPSEILINNKVIHGIYRDGMENLWILVPRGSQQIILRGPLPNRDVVQLPISLRPHNVTASGTGWTVEGLHQDGQAESTLELRRVQKGTRKNRESWEAKNLPPFVLVEREIALGLSWKIRTRVSRLTPSGSAVVLAIPLLPGESVTTSKLRVDKGKARVNMGPNTNEFLWDSVLDATSPLSLTAPKANGWTEEWRLDASEIWTVGISGIPVIHYFNEEGKKVPMWRPWPGETVKIEVNRSKPIQGQTLSIQSSELDLRPGKRTTSATLSFVLQSSRGGEHVIELPANSELRHLKIKNISQPIRPDGSKLTIPIIPGRQEVEVAWTESRGISTSFKSSKINLGSKSVNSSVKVRLPHSRWILMAGGPSVGPAVLIWGELIIILLAALLLGKWKQSPLKTREWILLGIGLSQSWIVTILWVVGMFFFLTLRKDFAGKLKNWQFNLCQLFLLGWGLVTGICLLNVLERGFFGNPRMHVMGNQSNIRLLQWFQDRIPELLPQPWTISLPLICYRLAMLIWAVWLAFALLRWIKWGWSCFSEDGLWRKKSKIIKTS